MINEPVKHDTHHLPAASAGGENAYYLRGCEAVQRSPSYAACLFKIGEIEAGRENVLHADCATAHRQKKCLAVEMREQERLQGVALYYFPRKPPQALLLSVKVTGDFGVPITNLTDPALIPRDPPAMKDRFVATKSAKPVDAFDRELEAADAGYAAAINASLASAGPPPGDLPLDRMLNAVPLPQFPKDPDPTPVVITHTPSGKSVLIERFEAAQERTKTAPERPPMNPGETPLQYVRRCAAARTSTPN